MIYGGGSIKNNGIYDNVMKVLNDADIKVTEFGEVEPNSQNTTINRGSKVCRDNDIDGAKQTIESLKYWFFNKLKLQSKLSDLGVNDKNFHAMAVKACNEGTDGMLRGLTSLTAQDLDNIYRLSL